MSICSVHVLGGIQKTTMKHHRGLPCIEGKVLAVAEYASTLYISNSPSMSEIISSVMH